MASHAWMSRAALSCALVLVGGCGLTLDLDPPDEALDAGRHDSGGRDAGMRGVCGDGIVNAGEECDDGNHVSNDGCEPDCTITCRTKDDCVVSEGACGAVSCADQICIIGPASSSTCVLPDNVQGTCRNGRCVPSDCGNGELDPGEECDDNNSTPGDGCEPDCTLTCRIDVNDLADNRCSDGIECNGWEICRVENGAPTCAPAEEQPEHLECLECDLVTGMLRLIDEDNDGYASIELACDERGGDCNDADPRIHPGAPDLAVPGNGVDDDCDGKIDEDVVTTCLRDADGDGYGAADGAMRAGSDMQCLDGWIPAPTATTIRYDCDDTNDDVFPGQSMFFAEPRPGCTGDLCWDYDCDGVHQRRWPREAQCLAIAGRRCEDEGWSLDSGLVVPDCGASGTWTTCTTVLLACLPALVGTSRTQQCR